MYYVIDLSDLGGLLFPYLAIFTNRKTDVRGIVKYVKHPDFYFGVTGSSIVELPQMQFDGGANAKYVVVKAEKDSTVRIGDRMAPGFAVGAKAYSTLPKKYAVPADFAADDTKGKSANG